MTDVVVAQDAVTASQDAAARVRIVRRERLEARCEAERLLAEAREQAVALRQQVQQEAQQEAERIRVIAEQQGFEQGAAKLAAAWLRYEKREAALDHGLMDRSIAMARLLAERLLGQSLQLHPEMVVDLARDAISQLSRSRRIVVHAHPEDVSPLRENVGAFGIPPDRIEILSDSSRSRGCLRFVSDCGDLDGDLVVQLDRLAEAIRQELGANKPA